MLDSVSVSAQAVVEPGSVSHFTTKGRTFKCRQLPVKSWNRLVLETVSLNFSMCLGGGGGVDTFHPVSEIDVVTSIRKEELNI